MTCIKVAFISGAFIAVMYLSCQQEFQHVILFTSEYSGIWVLLNQTDGPATGLNHAGWCIY